MDAPRKSSPRRFGAKDSATRTALVLAGIELLRNEGSNAFTAKRVAEQAGLKPQLVHYYFRTMEDLLLAIVDHAGGEALKRAARAAASREPLRELWNVQMSERSAALTAEIKALAQHSRAVRDATVRQQEMYRTLMSEAIERHFEERGGKAAPSPMTVVMIIDAIARLLVSEAALGFTLGHEQLKTAIEQWLDDHYAGAAENGGRPG
jgi:AcrR family transcriptional regulator